MHMFKYIYIYIYVYIYIHICYMHLSITYITIDRTLRLTARTGGGNAAASDRQVQEGGRHRQRPGGGARHAGQSQGP